MNSHSCSSYLDRTLAGWFQEAWGNRYLIQDLQEEDTLGQVWSATDAAGADRVRIRLLRPEWTLHPSFARQFNDRLTRAAQVEGLLSPALREWGQSGGRYYLVMDDEPEEETGGPSLHALLFQATDAYLTEPEALRIVNRMLVLAAQLEALGMTLERMDFRKIQLGKTAATLHPDALLESLTPGEDAVERVTTTPAEMPCHTTEVLNTVLVKVIDRTPPGLARRLYRQQCRIRKKRTDRIYVSVEDFRKDFELFATRTQSNRRKVALVGLLLMMGIGLALAYYHNPIDAYLRRSPVLSIYYEQLMDPVLDFLNAL